MMSSLGEAKDTDLSVEDEVSSRRGYTAVLTSSKISKKAKRNALDLLNDELDGDTPRHYLDEVPDQSKEQEKTDHKSPDNTLSESD
ncbi:hypothetical protein N7537_001695 [Penicillium hordei]|uniref:Uncharacterized protein n=1 Tax=Penicillium hordei TaxID=40994 RepID=A0AAD6EGL2_9EURO|nr:uncharacterized protein N7537_001695 [Penicillium hordei]KAJ5616581.1 hypothetical protein N7537_001695 [Penicillium hordei]